MAAVTGVASNTIAVPKNESKEWEVDELTQIFATLNRKQQTKSLNKMAGHFVGSKKQISVRNPHHVQTLFLQSVNSETDLAKKKQYIEDAKVRLNKYDFELPNASETVDIDKARIDEIINTPVTPPKANLSFSEKTFQDLSASIKAFVEVTLAHRQLEAVLSTKVNEKDYDNKQVVSDYSKMFNASIDLLKGMNSKDEEIKKLKEDFEKAANEYKSRNEKWITYLQDKCSELAAQHGLLANAVVNGGVTKTVKMTWATPVVKVASSTSTSRYEAKDVAAASAEYDETAFTSFFDDMAAYKTNFEVLLKAFRTHFGKVEACKYALGGNPPDADALKIKAAKLLKKYEELHDECLDTFARLAQDNKSIVALLAKVSKSFEQMKNEVEADRQLLKTETNELAKVCRTINPIKSRWNDPIKDLNVNMNDKDKVAEAAAV